MMNIELFRSHLQTIDAAIGTTEAKMFDCMVEQISENHFYYVVDALCGTQIVFREDGMVEQMFLVMPDEEFNAHQLCGSVEDWIEESIELMTKF